jgi:Txe/YoeB family toxin of Txe-Axe toxin-antitoxin module
MKLTAHSKNRLMESARQWSVPREYFEPISNYLVYGFEPGSFFTALLANDFFRAMQHSHPGNSIPELKHLTSWIESAAPFEAFGSYQKVTNWLRFDDEYRRALLVQRGLVYTVEEEVMLVLQGAKTHEPFLG